MILYRPTGLDELRLVYESGMRAWPPRLPEQPIFYPVLNFGYAEQIARGWNTSSRSFAGYVTRFEGEEPYTSHFERCVVGEREHEELWVPAEELDELNRHIVGKISWVAAYFGPRFLELVPERGKLAGLDAAGQFVRLRALAEEGGAALREEVLANHTAVFLHYPFWERGRTLREVREVWSASYPGVRLADS